MIGVSLQRSIVGAMAFLALAMSLAACGGGGGSTTADSGATEATSESTAASSDFLAEAAKEIEAVEQGTEVEPPPGPPAQGGKDVWFICIAAAFPPCVDATAGVKEAANVLGWNLTVVDGKGDPASWTAGLKQAVAANADGIYALSIDCASAKAGYEAAKQADIPVVVSTSIDCPDAPMFTAVVQGAKSPTWIDYYERQGKLRADYAALLTDGEAKVIMQRLPEVEVTNALDKTFEARLAECEGCEILATQDLTAADLAAPTAGQELLTLFQQYPDANILLTDNDSYVQGVAQALRQANRKDIQVIAGEGYPTTFELIREGYIAAAFTMPLNWTGWAAMDYLNRIFAGEDPKQIPPAGFDTTIVTKENVPPEGEGLESTIDYRAAYERSWTGGE